MIEIRRTDEFAQWLKRLKDSNAKSRINLRIRRISLTGNFGNYKPVGDGISELRIDYGPGYRAVFCTTWEGSYFAAHRRRQIVSTTRYRESQGA